MESQETISPPIAFAISAASALFPDAVGPTIAISFVFSEADNLNSVLCDVIVPHAEALHPPAHGDGLPDMGVEAAADVVVPEPFGGAQRHTDGETVL